MASSFNIYDRNTLPLSFTSKTIQVYTVILVGRSNTGKTALLKRMTGRELPQVHSATVGVDYYRIYAEVDGQPVSVALWDTAGQERFQSVVSSYYRGAHGVFLVYDRSEPETFTGLRFCLKEVERLSQPGVTVHILGNKTDLPSSQMCQLFHDPTSPDPLLQLPHFLVSAYTGSNVKESLGALLRAMIAKRQVYQPSTPSASMRLSDENQSSSSTCC
eukprot:GILI01043238.1.p1 GENE.GILI01043238.1~~GILI01043238.1.p1  ORF type:complete len:217 (+),score=49.74 GILI01043238.1:98-748(+)